ncbi:hypothetical protein ACOMHN_011070 [Nucella lapillus]
MAGAWSQRKCGYKLGVISLFPASIFYLIGYAAPFWIVRPFGNIYNGLWMACVPLYSNLGLYGLTVCGSVADEAGWFKAVQTFESLGLMGLVVSCVYALVVNCCNATMAPHRRFLEILIALSGLSGFIGCMIFVAMTDIQVRKYLGWAFSLNLTGCLLAMIIVVVIFGSNVAERPQPTTPGVVYYPGLAAVPGSNVMVAPPQGRGYHLPPAGVMYGAHDY